MRDGTQVEDVKVIRQVKNLGEGPEQPGRTTGSARRSYILKNKWT